MSHLFKLANKLDLICRYFKVNTAGAPAKGEGPLLKKSSALYLLDFLFPNFLITVKNM